MTFMNPNMFKAKLHNRGLAIINDKLNNSYRLKLRINSTQGFSISKSSDTDNQSLQSGQYIIKFNRI